MKNEVFYSGLMMVFLLFFAVNLGCASKQEPPAVLKTTSGTIQVYSYEKKGLVMSEKVVKTDAEWKKLLAPEQYHILREKGTEQATTGIYDKHHERGVYRCAGCGLDLFRSEDKYDSGTGWPSFFAPISPNNIMTAVDYSFFSRRTEVLCRRCEGHLGHVFDDGPKPTGLRYCMNSAALQFEPVPK